MMKMMMMMLMMMMMMMIIKLIMLMIMVMITDGRNDDTLVFGGVCSGFALFADVPK